MNKLLDIFKDTNDINEKSLIGFISFMIMLLIACFDIGTGLMGKEFPIHEFIYDSFLILTLGSFGISEVGKIMTLKNHLEKINNLE